MGCTASKVTQDGHNHRIGAQLLLQNIRTEQYNLAIESQLRIEAYQTELENDRIIHEIIQQQIIVMHTEQQDALIRSEHIARTSLSVIEQHASQAIYHAYLQQKYKYQICGTYECPNVSNDIRRHAFKNVIDEFYKFIRNATPSMHIKMSNNTDLQDRNGGHYNIICTAPDGALYVHKLGPMNFRQFRSMMDFEWFPTDASTMFGDIVRDILRNSNVSAYIIYRILDDMLIIPKQIMIINHGSSQKYDKNICVEMDYDMQVPGFYIYSGYRQLYCHDAVFGICDRCHRLIIPKVVIHVCGV